MNNSYVRQPTHGEKQALLEWQSRYGMKDYTDNEIKGYIENASIAVFPHYMTDCPGYVGKIMDVVWGGSPSFFECFVWEEGSLSKEPQDIGMR